MRHRAAPGEPPLWRRYLRFHGLDVAADVEDELALHVQLLVEEYEAAGMTPEEAQRAARKRFGDYRSVERECLHIGQESARMMRRSEWFRGMGQDVRHAARSLARSPGFALATVLVLALGIGANTAIFSVVNAVLLKPLPYQQPADLVRIYETFAVAGGEPGEGSVSYPNFLDWREQSRSFESMVLLGGRGSLTLQGRGEAERITAFSAGAELFSVLGARPKAGRGFLPGEDEPGASRVAVLSEQGWRTRFGGNPGVLGSTLTLDGEPYTVVGIMPDEFQYPAGAEAPDMWVPLPMGGPGFQNRGFRAFGVLARLKPGVTRGAAEAEMRRITAIQAEQHPEYQEGRSAAVWSLHERLVGDVRPTLLVLLGAAGLVLLIACANAASLLLARAVARQREVAVRSALGASRGRVIQGFLAESLLLAGIGAVLGLFLAWLGLRAISVAAAELLPRATEIGIDLRVAGFLSAVTLAVGVVFGLYPALQATRANLQDALREGGRSGTTGRAGQAFRSTLVVVQLALSLVLLVGAGLLMRTFIALLGTETGMATENVLTMRVALPESRYDTVTIAQTRFYDPVLERVREIPGVTAAGFASRLPLQDWGAGFNFGIVGKTFANVNEMPSAEVRLVSTGYFEALGIPVLRGRDIRPEDGPGAVPVAVVNRTAAERYFPGEDPIGQRITDFSRDTFTIVGVVGDVRQAGLDAPPLAEAYFHYVQLPWEWQEMSLVARTGTDPSGLAPAIRREIRAVDPQLPVFDVIPMTEVVSSSVADRRLYLWLLGSFAAVAMALAIAGIYGVVSYSVTQRTREFGIRLALGSGAERVRHMVVWQGGRLVLVGLLIGIPAAYLLTRLLAGLLYGVGAADPLTYLGVALLLGAVALVASYIPALRATRVDPSIALRTE